MIRSWRAPRRAVVEEAERLIDDLLVRAPAEIDVAYAAAWLEAAIVVERIPRAEGSIVMTASGSVISIEQRVAKTPRGRFVAAHEIGHLVLHSDAGEDAWCRGISGRFFQREIDASDFAANFLAPRAFLRTACSEPGVSIQRASAVAGAFRISLSLALQGWAELTPEPMAVVSSQRGVIKWWVASDAFPFKLTKGFALGRRAHAFSYESLTFHESHGGPEAVEATAWSSDRRARGAELLEQSIGFSGADAGAITLLVQH